MRLALILAACVTIALQAQAPPRDAQGATAPAVMPTGTATLGGVVVDETGRPLARATVLVHGDRSVDVSTITDARGRWSIAGLPAGRFTITASKPAYPSMSYGAKRPNRAGSGVLLSEGQALDTLTLSLPRGAALSGVVFDDRGQPMPGVPVMAWEVRTTLGGERTLDFPATGGESVTTDDRGAYRVYGLPAGEYTVGTAWFYSGMSAGVRVPTDDEIRAAFAAAQRPPAIAAAPAVKPPPLPASEYNFTAVFLPGTTDPGAAATVQVEAGEEHEGLDLRMQFKPMSAIVGTVAAPEGASAIEMRLEKRTRVAALNSTRYWSASDGKFTTQSLPPGDYTLSAHLAAGKDTPAMWALADVTVAGAEPVTVALTMSPAMTVTGQVVFDGSTPPPADLSTVRIALLPLPDSGARIENNIVVDASGAFSVSGVVPGRYRVTANVPSGAAPPAWTMRSTTVQGEDVTDLPIAVTPGSAPAVKVTLSDQVGELSGTVTDRSGKPATDYFVIAIPDDNKYWIPGSRRIVSTRPDLAGQYRFRGLPAGAYRIAATTDLVQRDLGDVGILAQIAEHATPVNLGIAEKKVFNLEVGR